VAPPLRTGINTVTRQQPDGSKVRHYYDRATRRYLGTDRDQAVAAALAKPTGAQPGTFNALCESYIASSAFKKLAPATRKLNRFYIDRLREPLGPLPVAGITRPVVVALREKHAERQWYATHLLSKLRLVLQHGVDTGVLRVNPALKPGGVKPPRRHAVWSPADTKRMLEVAGADIRLACALLLYTAQRPADALSMTWEQIQDRDGRLWLTLRQAKTGELVDVPAHRDLERLLRDADRRSSLLVPSPTGLPWSYRNFSRSWDRMKAKAGVADGLQRRDLRRTAMVRMAEAGATTAQIAAVSGHTIDQTSRILDTYIPRRSEVAAGAIDAWEAMEKRSVVVPMPAVQQRVPDAQQPICNDVQRRSADGPLSD
jgi:integrase